ncbi:MAG: hypothetical protein ABI609_06285 [Acidobacteriota bacterium]
MSDTVERAKNAVSDAVSEGVDAARERFDDVADDFDRRYKTAAKEARKVSAAAREKYDAAVDTLRDGYARARKDFNRISNDATDYVKENPGKSLLIAAGVGFLIGLAVRRRRD